MCGGIFLAAYNQFFSIKCIQCPDLWNAIFQMQWGPLSMSHEVSWHCQKKKKKCVVRIGTMVGAADTAGLPSARHKADLSSHTEQTLLQPTGQAAFLHTQGKDSISVNTRRPTFCHTEKTSLLHAQSWHIHIQTYPASLSVHWIRNEWFPELSGICWVLSLAASWLLNIFFSCRIVLGRHSLTKAAPGEYLVSLEAQPHATGTSLSRSCSGCRHAQLQKLEQLCGKHLCLLFQSQFLILEVIQMIKTKINVSLLFKWQLLRIRGQSISPAPRGACLGFQTQGTCAHTSWDSLADSHAVDKKVKRLPALPPSSWTLEPSKILDKKISCGLTGISLTFPGSNLLKARAKAVRK